MIELEVNGRIFPSWVLKNFKKFTLPEIIRKAGEDPCNEKLKAELTPYQRFLGQFLNYRSPFKDMLVFHGVGSGKTVSAINIYNVLFNFTPKWNVFLLIPASLRNDPWLKDLGNWLEKSDKDLRMKKQVSQNALAYALSVSRQTINSIENGKFDPSLTLAIKMTRYFELPLDKIFIYED